MSLKDNIGMVKEELTSEEKFFEKAVVTEKFVKKYKNIIIGTVIVIVLYVAGNIIYNIKKQHTLQEANVALLVLKKNPKDSAALKKLQSLSPILYDMWLYSQADADENVKELEKLESSKALMLNDLSSYEVAQNLQDEKKLQAYTEKQGAIYKDLAQVQVAILLMNEGKIQEAHENLRMISIDSPVATVAKALMHYGVK